MAINSTYNLADLMFIGGCTKNLYFNCYDENGNPLDLNGATCTWKLRRFGDYGDSALITKTGIIITTNQFKIILNSSDTINFYGKFVQQPIVTDFSGKIYFPGQGIITIEPSIQ